MGPYKCRALLNKENMLKSILNSKLKFYFVDDETIISETFEIPGGFNIKCYINKYSPSDKREFWISFGQESDKNNIDIFILERLSIIVQEDSPFFEEFESLYNSAIDETDNVEKLIMEGLNAHENLA